MYLPRPRYHRLVCLHISTLGLSPDHLPIPYFSSIRRRAAIQNGPYKYFLHRWADFGGHAAVAYGNSETTVLKSTLHYGWRLVEAESSRRKGANSQICASDSQCCCINLLYACRSRLSCLLVAWRRIAQLSHNRSESYSQPRLD